MRVSRWTLLWIAFLVLLVIGWRTGIPLLREARGAEGPVVVGQWRLVTFSLPLVIAGAVFMALIYHAWFLSPWLLSPTRFAPALRVPLLIFWGMAVVIYATVAVGWIAFLFGRG